MTAACKVLGWDTLQLTATYTLLATLSDVGRHRVTELRHTQNDLFLEMRVPRTTCLEWVHGRVLFFHYMEGKAAAI